MLVKMRANKDVGAKLTYTGLPLHSISAAMQEQRLQLDYQHRHHLLLRIYRVAVLSSLAGTLLAWLIFEWPTTVSIFTGLVLMLFGNGLVKRGHQRYGAWLMLATLSALVPLLANFGEGSNDSALFFFFPMMILAGLFFDKRGYWAFAFLLAAEIVLVNVAEAREWLRPTSGPITAAVLWSECAVMLLAHFGNCALINVVLSGVGLFVVSKTTRMAEQTAAWHRAAITDALTGLLNRRGFMDQAERHYRRAVIDSKPVALMMIDIDYFKSINDGYGHDAGDLVIQQVAQHLQKDFRASDITARFGGEEFCVLLTGVNPSTAIASAERLRENLARPAVVAANAKVPFTVSIGVACADSASELTRLIKLADLALYDAKQNGRNVVRVRQMQEGDLKADASHV